jgi:hypothetical protein
LGQQHIEFDARRSWYYASDNNGNTLSDASVSAELWETTICSNFADGKIRRDSLGGKIGCLSA